MIINQPTMRPVSFIGLGDMGATLAATVLHKGHPVTVWNRNNEKAIPLVRNGALPASDPAAAIRASDIIIFCVTDYEVSHRILESEGAAEALKGKVLIQLSTGTPADARRGEAIASGHGALYLDGAILATPSQIGRPDAPLFVSGSEEAYSRSEAVLRHLAGGLQYMGRPAGAAAAWDLAFLSYLFGGMTGFFHGALLMESEGISVEGYGEMIAQVSPVIGDMIRYEGKTIQSGNYDTPQSNLNICVMTFNLLLRHAEEAGINNEWPRFAMDLYGRGQKAGYGAKEVGVLVEYLKETRNTGVLQ